MLRRQLFDKRPIIENKLLSGRQFLASEPTPSDTSDSDSKITNKNIRRKYVYLNIHSANIFLIIFLHFFFKETQNTRRRQGEVGNTI